jgi:galactose mutarotase-like enzyme
MNYQTYHHNRNYGCRITESLLQGHRSVTLENEKLRVTVIADKGADIYEFLYKPRDLDFLWRTRTGLRERAHFLQTTPRPAGPHLDYYEGGWQELFPNCGNFSEHQGAEIGQHGEVMLLPWRYAIIKDDPEEIEVRFEVRCVRTPFHLVRILSLRRNDATLRIGERVTNESGQSVDFTWGHHPAFGWPFIDESCRIELPPCRIITLAEYTGETSRLRADQQSDWPVARARDGSLVDISRPAGPDSASTDMVFLKEAAEGWYTVTNTNLGVGFTLRYPVEIFKVLWFWQVYRGGFDYPWWGAIYTLALEPCASMPVLSEAARSGEALRLSAGESLDVELLAIAFEN